MIRLLHSSCSIAAQMRSKSSSRNGYGNINVRSDYIVKWHMQRNRPTALTSPVSSTPTALLQHGRRMHETRILASGAVTIHLRFRAVLDNSPLVVRIPWGSAWGGRNAAPLRKLSCCAINHALTRARMYQSAHGPVGMFYLWQRSAGKARTAHRKRGPGHQRELCQKLRECWSHRQSVAHRTCTDNADVRVGCRRALVSSPQSYHQLDNGHRSASAGHKWSQNIWRRR